MGAMIQLWVQHLGQGHFTDWNEGGFIPHFIKTEPRQATFNLLIFEGIWKQYGFYVITCRGYDGSKLCSKHPSHLFSWMVNMFYSDPNDPLFCFQVILQRKQCHPMSCYNAAHFQVFYKRENGDTCISKHYVWTNHKELTGYFV